MITDRIIPPEIKEKIRILVVEDSILNQKLDGHMLDNWGFKHDICTNGIQAIAFLKSNTYDLILMDIQMPEMNGYETIKYIRRDLNSKVPIIVTTGYSDGGKREKCLSFGVTDYITKPIKGEELYNAVTEYLFLTVVETHEDGK